MGATMPETPAERRLEARWQRGLKSALYVCMLVLLVMVTPPAFFGVRYSPTIETMLGFVAGVIMLVSVPVGHALLVLAIRERPSVLQLWGMRLILIGFPIVTIPFAVLLVAQLVFGIAPSAGMPILGMLTIVVLVGIAIIVLGSLVAFAESVAAFVRMLRSARGSRGGEETA